MGQQTFAHWLLEGGQVVIPVQLLDKLSSLNISPENLGYLVLGLAKYQMKLPPEEMAKDRWVKWCLSEGWAQWQGRGEQKKISFGPLWNRLQNAWEKNQQVKPVDNIPSVEFNYSRILKWLDQVRGTLSVTMREKQVIQELNLKYGWSSDFILIFLQLAFERNHTQVQAYQSLAKKVYESGIDTVDGLVTFMDNLDWVQYKVIEVKKCIGQFGGATSPQREMYLKWNREWKMNHELIMKAAEETVRTNNPSFKYIDAILTDWRAKGVVDKAQAEKAMAEHDQKREIPARVNTNGKSKRFSPTGNRDLEKLLGLE